MERHSCLLLTPFAFTCLFDMSTPHMAIYHINTKLNILTRCGEKLHVKLTSQREWRQQKTHMLFHTNACPQVSGVDESGNIISDFQTHSCFFLILTIARNQM